MNLHTVVDKDLVSGRGSLITTVDQVEDLEREDRDPYFLQFDPMYSIVADPMESVRITKELDYVLGGEGELIYRASVKRKDIVFDINRRGELTVIGADGDKYYLSENGELWYYMEGNENDSFVGDALWTDANDDFPEGGQMLHGHKLYHDRSKLYSHPRS